MERGSLDSVLKHDDANEFSWPLKGHTVALDCLRGLVELHFRFTVPICHLGKSLLAEKPIVFLFLRYKCIRSDHSSIITLLFVYAANNKI